MRTCVSKSTSVMSSAAGSMFRNLIAAPCASFMSACMLPLASTIKPEVHRRAGVAVAVREVLDRLRLAVLDDLEVVLREIGDDIALLVGDGGGKGGEVDAGAEDGLGLRE